MHSWIMSSRVVFLAFLVCLVLQVCAGLQSELAKKWNQNPIYGYSPVVSDYGINERLYEDDEDSKGVVPFVRRKRGIGSVIVFGASMLMRGTSLGVTIAGVLTEGCAFFKSICRDKDRIAVLDAEIRKLKKEFDVLYRVNGKSYVDLKQAFVNNGYILYYTNETIRSVESIEDLTKSLIEKISQKNFPTFAKIADSISRNVTSEDYLKEVVGQLEYSLEYLTDRIQQTKTNQLVGIAVQYLVEAVLNKFMTAYSNAYGQVAEDIFYKSQLQNMFNNENGVNPEQKVGFFKKVKLVPKVFKQMGKNVGKYFKDGWRSLKKWKRINSWKGFKGKLAHSLRKPLAKIKAIKNFITDTGAWRQAIQDYSLDWSQRISMTIGIIADAISIAATIHEWSKVRDEVAQARDNYEAYKANLAREFTETKTESEKLQSGWENTTENFVSVTKSIRSLFIDLANNSDFNGVMGLGGLPVNFVDDYLPSNFENVKKEDLLAKQAVVINFLKEINHNFTEIREDLNARLIMYEHIEQGVNADEPIAEMLQTLKNIYKYKTGEEKLYGTSLTDRTIICATAVKFPLRTEYDFYSLVSLRPRCEISDAQFASVKAQALEKRKRVLLLQVVKDEVSKDSSVSLEHLLNSVKNAYSYSSDENIKSFGNTITEKDVNCAVATQFQQMSTFDFLPLAPFRPECSAVSDSDFANMKQAVVNKKLVADRVGGTMDMCDNYKFCPCISAIIKSLQSSGITASESDVKAAIKAVRPQLIRYCGTTNCACVDM